jgi:hypothetical protein
MEAKGRRRKQLDCLNPQVRQVSNAAMVDILNTIRKHPEVLENSSSVTRQDLDRLHEDHIRKVEKTLRLPHTTPGQHVDVTICDIGLLLHHLVSKRQGMQAMYASAIAAKPPSMENPWSLVVAFDEFTPGAQLTGKHLRKVMNVHVTFMELGRTALASNTAWMTPISDFACFLLSACGAPRMCKHNAHICAYGATHPIFA